jgi:hypothetical protein
LHEFYDRILDIDAEVRNVLKDYYNAISDAKEAT